MKVLPCKVSKGELMIYILFNGKTQEEIIYDGNFFPHMVANNSSLLENKHIFKDTNST